MTKIKQNSLKAWLLAIRPKTLTGAAAPVLIALAMSYVDARGYQPPMGQTSVFQWVPALLCLFFAFLMQIDANLINDYFDCINGVDDDTRLGPERACAQGWVSMRAMQRAIALCTCLSIAVGLPTIFWGGLELLIVGLLCVLFAFLYTTMLAKRGLGDLLVFVFFGIVPVCITYYVQLHTITRPLLAMAVAMGLVTDTLLLVNNYRDREGDRNKGKNTLVVTIGPRATEWLYLGLGVLGVLLCQIHWLEGSKWSALLPLAYLLPHVLTWRSMCRIAKGRALNKTLGQTARNIFIFALLSSIGIVLDDCL